MIAEILQIPDTRILVAFKYYGQVREFCYRAGISGVTCRTEIGSSMIHVKAFERRFDYHSCAGLQISHLFCDYTIDPETKMFLRSRVRSSHKHIQPDFNYRDVDHMVFKDSVEIRRVLHPDLEK